MKKFILLILGMQISFACFANQVTTFTLPSPALFDASKCDKVVKIYFDAQSNFTDYIPPVNVMLVSVLSKISADFTKECNLNNPQIKSDIEKKTTAALKTCSIMHDKEVYNTEQVFTVRSLEGAPKYDDPIHAIREKSITIEGDPRFTFNKDTLLPDPIKFVLAAGSEKYIVDFSEIRRCDHISNAFQQCHYHIAKVIITHHQRPTIFSHPLWQPTLKWSALAIVGFGGLAAGYFAYHKWFKK